MSINIERFPDMFILYNLHNLRNMEIKKSGYRTEPYYIPLSYKAVSLDNGPLFLFQIYIKKGKERANYEAR